MSLIANASGEGWRPLPPLQICQTIERREVWSAPLPEERRRLRNGGHDNPGNALAAPWVTRFGHELHSSKADHAEEVGMREMLPVRLACGRMTTPRAKQREGLQARASLLGELPSQRGEAPLTPLERPTRQLRATIRQAEDHRIIPDKGNEIDIADQAFGRERVAEDKDRLHEAPAYGSEECREPCSRRRFSHDHNAVLNGCRSLRLQPRLAFGIATFTTNRAPVLAITRGGKRPWIAPGTAAGHRTGSHPDSEHRIMSETVRGLVCLDERRKFR